MDHTDGVCSGGAKLEVLVVSDAFDKLPLLKRHRMVNDSLMKSKDNDNDNLMDQIHALQLKTWTPAQYESKK